MGSATLPKCIIAVFGAAVFANAFVPFTPTRLQRSAALMPRIKDVSQNNDNTFYSNINNINRNWKSILFESDRSRGANTGPKNGSTSKNEFSRTIRVSKWFGTGGGSASHRKANKSMDLSISATPEECHALATRFRLTNISSLSADLVVHPALGVGSGRSSGGGSGGRNVEDSECIEAKGTVCAQVTQTCVRTNEDFDVTLEFSFDTVLKAMSSTTGNSGGSSANAAGSNDNESLSLGELAALEAASKLDGGGGGGRQRKNKKGGTKKRGVKGVRGGQQSIDDMGMNQLKDILMEYEVTDEIIEDEACFCNDGIVDCGEIVAQMFRSKLDPYPKKPGSDPVSYSFTF